MLARELTSCGANSWCRPWRDRKAMLSGVEEDGRAWLRIVMGEDGWPQGVLRAGWESGR